MIDVRTGRRCDDRPHRPPARERPRPRAGRRRGRDRRSIDGPIVVTGAGSCFSAGVDLRAVLDGGREYTEPVPRRDARRVPRRLRLTPRRWSQRSTGTPSRAVASSRWPPTCGSCLVGPDRPHRGRGRRALPGGGTGDLPLRDGHLRLRRSMLGAQTTSTPGLQRSADGSTRWCRRMTCCPSRSRSLVRSGSTRRSPTRAMKDATTPAARAAIDAAAEIDASVREGGWKFAHRNRGRGFGAFLRRAQVICAAADLHAVAVAGREADTHVAVAGSRTWSR